MNKSQVIERIKEQVAKVDREQGLPFSNHDVQLLGKMMTEINQVAGCSYSISTFDDLHYYLPNCGVIVDRYIYLFQSQMIRGLLLRHLVGNPRHGCLRVPLAAEKVYDLFLDYKRSNEYSDSIIQRDYDNAFSQLKPKRYYQRLFEESANPFDFNRMPLTMRMLAKAHIPELKDLMINYLTESNVIETYINKSKLLSAFIDDDFVNREVLRWDYVGIYTILAGLTYYPSIDILKALTDFKATLEHEKAYILSGCNDQEKRKDLLYVYRSKLKAINKAIDTVSDRLKGLS